MKTTLFQYDSLDTWLDDLPGALGSLGYSVRQERRGLFAYEKTVPTNLEGVVRADGFLVVREPLEQGECALGVKDHRKYFLESSGEPVRRPEQVLFAGSPPAYPAPHERVRASAALGEELGGILPGFADSPVEPGAVALGVHEKTMLVPGGGRAVPAKAKIGQLLKYNGFNKNPDDLRVLVIGEDLSNQQFQGYAKCISAGFSNYGIKGKLRMMDFARARELGPGDFPAGTVGLLALAGSSDTPPSVTEGEMMDRLDELGAGYRMFSLRNPELFWSSLDQVGILASLAGGIPYAMDFGWPDGEPVYSVGVDLGHPLHRGPSVLAVSLLSPDGLHLGTFTSLQKRDETADSRTLDAMLRKAALLARDHGGESETNFLVLRDGRRNPGETLPAYRNALSPRLSLVDVSKRVNAYVYDPLRYAPGNAGDVLFLGEERLPLAVTAPSATRMQIPTLRKIRVDRSWDGLGLGTDKIAEVVCGMAYSPALGLKPHGNPGPVYWADGAASVSAANCHFRGVKNISSVLTKELLLNKT